VALVVVDGDNLLHGSRGQRDGTGEAWLLARLRSWRPPEIELVLVLDGYPEPGAGFRRPFGAGFEVRHSGAIDGDGAILRLIRERPMAQRSRALVVTDDRLLADRAQAAGAHRRTVAWLVGQLAPGAPPSTRSGDAPSDAAARPVGLGNGRRTAGATRPDRDPDRTPWAPGRGATRKRGNPKRDAR
jgi:hypothetical protein